MPYPAAMGASGEASRKASPGRAPREWMRRIAATALCATGLLAARSTAAQPAALHDVPVVVQRAPAASDCVDAATLAGRVNLLVGRTALIASEAAGESFAFEVQILRSDDGYTAIVLAAGGSRKLDDPGPTCAGLSDALAVTLAVLVDADEKPVAPPPPPPPPPATATAVFVPPPPPPSIPPRYGPRLLLSPIIAVTSGLSGDAVPAVVLVNDLRVIGPFSLLAGFTWMPSQDYPLREGHIEVQLMYGQLAACLSSWRVFGRSRLGGCFQVDVGGIRGKGVGYDETSEITRPWVGLGLTGLADVPIIDPLYWSTRISAFAVPTQEAFQIRGIGVAFDPPPVGILVGTGVGVRFF